MEDKSITDKAKDLGKLLLRERDLDKKKASKGNNVIVFISNTCIFCSATIDSWHESKTLKSYLSSNDINLFFIEKHLSPKLVESENVHTYPNMAGYQDGNLVGRFDVMAKADEFIDYLNNWYKR
jgi:hypothetical protein